MSIRDAENEIFEQWKARYGKKIVPDGMVCEQAYKASKIKLMLILKEVNDEGAGGWDLRDFLNDGGRPATWNSVAAWLKGITSPPDKWSYEESSRTATPQRPELLRSIVCMNLKKYGGGSSTNKKELRTVAKANGDLLNKQFEIYSDLDYVICGGPDVKHLAKELIVPIRNAGPWQRMPETSVEYLEFAPQKYAIAFWHPQQRHFKHKEVYDWIVNTIAVLEARKRQEKNHSHINNILKSAQ